MKKKMGVAFLFCGILFLAVGCETVRTYSAPDDAYGIRKPADTTRAVEQEDVIILERY